MTATATIDPIQQAFNREREKEATADISYLRECLDREVSGESLDEKLQTKLAKTLIKLGATPELYREYLNVRHEWANGQHFLETFDTDQNKLRELQRDLRFKIERMRVELHSLEGQHRSATSTADIRLAERKELTDFLALNPRILGDDLVLAAACQAPPVRLGDVNRIASNGPGTAETFVRRIGDR